MNSTLPLAMPATPSYDSMNQPLTSTDQVQSNQSKSYDKRAYFRTQMGFTALAIIGTGLWLIPKDPLINRFGVLIAGSSVIGIVITILRLPQKMEERSKIR